MEEKKDEYEINVHNTRFIELKSEVLDEIHSAYLEGYEKVLIIHGYKNGTAIKRYFKIDFSKDFKMYCEKTVTIRIENVQNNPGCTRICFIDK